jgi:hypothetical protein
MDNELNESLKAVEGTTLFYPCSGADLAVPIRLFSPAVSEFWFVDLAYFRSDVNYCWNGERADQVKAVLSAEGDYELIEKTIDGPPTACMESKTIDGPPTACMESKTIDGPPTACMESRTIPTTGKRYPYLVPYLVPCVLTETYKHNPTGKTVKVHRRRGYGKIAFDKVISSLGVFFYRGDSEGDGGSGYHWLWPQALRPVLAKLISGGLIVTDGSQHHSRKYREFWKHKGTRSGRKAMDDAMAFTRDGCSFTCVGYADNRYGPTLIWRVVKQTESQASP